MNKDFHQDVRTVLGRRSRVAIVEDRLVEAVNNARPITLTLRDASNLLTLLRAARRVATLAARRPTDLRDMSDRVAVLQSQLTQSEQAWAAAERGLHQWELAHAQTQEPTP